MSFSQSLPSTLQNIVLAQEDSNLRKLLLGLAGIVVLAIASQLSVPLTPVPLTFQSATVVLLGMAYGPRYGTYIILSYLTLGALGVPVYADFSAGLHVLAGPTGGYLLGFIPAAWVSGYLAQRGFAKNIIFSFFAASVGITFIFCFGLLQLSSFVGWDTAIATGLLPFIASEPIKLLVVAIMIPRLWKKTS